MATPRGNDPILDNLVWSDIEYRLCDFVDRFQLPQIVKVTEGYYGPTEDSCIGADQILTIHSVKTTGKILARDRKKRELNIPLNCSQKVELRPEDFRGIYETVEEISSIPTRFVRVTQGFFGMDDNSVCLNPGDKLEMINIEFDPVGKEYCILFHNEERIPFRLPFSASAGFQALVDGREYYLKEVVSSSPKLPLYFQFTSPPSITKCSSEHVFNTGLGVLSLEKVYQDATVICTTKEGNERTVVSCPKHLPVTINVARGALSDDKEYVRICRTFHEIVSLGKIESMEIQNIYASRDTIREYHIEMASQQLHTASEGSLQNLPKNSLVSTRDNSHASDSDDSDEHEYNYIDDWPVPPAKCTESRKNNSDPLPATSISQATAEDLVEKDTDDKEQNENITNLNPQKVVSSSTVASDTNPIAPPRKPKSEVKKTTGVNQQGMNKKRPPPPPKPKPKPKPKPWAKETESAPPLKERDFKVPNNLSQISELTVSEVSDLLRHFHFDAFVDVFAENLVDGGLFVSLDEEDLRALGMNSFECKKVKKIIGGWRPKE